MKIRNTFLQLGIIAALFGGLFYTQGIFNYCHGLAHDYMIVAGTCSVTASFVLVLIIVGRKWK